MRECGGGVGGNGVEGRVGMGGVCGGGGGSGVAVSSRGPQTPLGFVNMKWIIFMGMPAVY